MITITESGFVLQNKTDIDKRLGWAGTLATILGALLVAAGSFLPGYIFMLFGAISWLLVAVRSGNASLAVLNVAFILINIFGLVNLGI